jgi:hypothetical protein
MPLVLSATTSAHDSAMSTPAKRDEAEAKHVAHSYFTYGSSTVAAHAINRAAADYLPLLVAHTAEKHGDCWKTLQLATSDTTTTWPKPTQRNSSDFS